jgi:mycothiol synthase
VRAAVTLRDLDLASSPEAQLRGAHVVAAPVVWSHVAGDELLPFEEWLAEERKRHTIVPTRHVVAEVDGEVVGHGLVELDAESNAHLGWAQLGVAEPHRRQGAGAQLLARLAEIAADDGRTSLGVSADEGSPGEAFAARAGLTMRQVVHLNRLRTADVDRTLLEGWVDRAPERASGYRLEAWDGPTPPDLVETFAACTEVMNTAPLGDLEIEDERMTPERLRRIEEARVAAGIDWWTVCAVERSTGAFVGFTQLSFSGWRKTTAKQNDTGVDPAHRDKGLGRWLKATNLLRLLDEKPEVAKVDTGNAGSNAPMLGINHAMGFRLAKVSTNWQGSIATVLERVGGR